METKRKGAVDTKVMRVRQTKTCDAVKGVGTNTRGRVHVWGINRTDK